MDFQTLRDQWAVKAPTPSTEEVEMQASIDRSANPHNEPYHNNRPLHLEARVPPSLTRHRSLASVSKFVQL